MFILESILISFKCPSSQVKAGREDTHGQAVWCRGKKTLKVVSKALGSSPGSATLCLRDPVQVT